MKFVQCPWIAAALALMACTKTSTVDAPDGSARDQYTADSADGRACSYEAAPYDQAAHCLRAKVETVGLCIQDKSTLSVYSLCIEGSDSQLYLGPLSSATARTSGEGWRFGPSWLADSLNAPHLSDDAEKICDEIAQVRPANCEDAGTQVVDAAK